MNREIANVPLLPIAEKIQKKISRRLDVHRLIIRSATTRTARGNTSRARSVSATYSILSVGPDAIPPRERFKLLAYHLYYIIDKDSQNFVLNVGMVSHAKVDHW